MEREREEAIQDGSEEKGGRAVDLEMRHYKIKKYDLRYRESNPGLVGESHVS